MMLCRCNCNRFLFDLRHRKYIYIYKKMLKCFVESGKEEEAFIGHCCIALPFLLSILCLFFLDFLWLICLCVPQKFKIIHFKLKPYYLFFRQKYESFKISSHLLD
jgi:hypothetical protein